MAVTINADTTNGLVMTPDTSGSISLQASGTTIATVSSTGIAMASGKVLAPTGPAFSAYQTSSQSISSATHTKLQFQAEAWDTNNCFDSSTNYRFTPTVAGYYQVNGRLQLTGFVNQVVALIYKNGSGIKDFYNTVISGGSFNSQGSAMVYLNGTTDYIELYAYISGGSSTQTASPTTFFEAFLARAA